MNVYTRFANLSPKRYALLVAGGYFVSAMFWIRFSTPVAELFAHSIDELAAIEMYKGYAYMFVTSLLFYAFSVGVFKKMRLASQEVIRNRERLVGAEREAIAGLLAASVAHDVANLLTVLRLNVERLKSTSSDSATVSEITGKLDSGVSRLTELAKRFRHAGQSLVKEPPASFDLNSEIEATLEFARFHESTAQCKIEFMRGEPVVVLGYPVLIHQLVMNLVLNAAQAAGAGGEVVVRVYHVHGASFVEVHDNGPGISPELRTRVFEAFYSTKSNGSGLGLMSAKSSVEMQGGQLNVETSSLLGGSAFIARLPDLDSKNLVNRSENLKASERLNKNPSPSPMN